ncbi:uncharacterized protein N0V89_000098 [Didymosphaeria variabile]|uniref:Uncharacterized protein n=1 Tax=Didymosphaeria variabile TaxID=1932322 RepID=A0A9W8XUH9_9PLEO|nr:uncharacterized protein N0V89_000098 [Didymosphaeria variabile]KAJ4359543.1 hypothetical protein N0V89_000098 [Didymosphaeria variabile]
MTSLRSISSRPQFAKSVQCLWLQADVPTEIDFDEWNEERVRFANAERDCNHYESEGVVKFSKLLVKWKREQDAEKKHQYGEKLEDLQRQMKEDFDEQSKIKLSDDDIQAHWKNYQRLVEDVDIMLEDSTIKDSVISLFENCPKLGGIEFTMGHHIRLSTIKLNKEFQEGLIMPFEEDHPYQKTFETFKALVQTAHHAGFAPKLLRLGGLSHRILLDADVAQHLVDFFKNLELLQWDFACPYILTGTNIPDSGTKFPERPDVQENVFYGSEIRYGDEPDVNAREESVQHDNNDGLDVEIYESNRN